MSYYSAIQEFNRIKYETIKKYEEVHGKFNDLTDVNYCFRVASEWLSKQQINKEKV